MNGWVFIYELSGCGFEYHCCHLCLRTICSNKKSSFNGLLVKDESVSFHNRIIQKLGIKMFKVLNGYNP